MPLVAPCHRFAFYSNNHPVVHGSYACNTTTMTQTVGQATTTVRVTPEERTRLQNIHSDDWRGAARIFLEARARQRAKGISGRTH